MWRAWWSAFTRAPPRRSWCCKAGEPPQPGYQTIPQGASIAALLTQISFMPLQIPGDIWRAVRRSAAVRALRPRCPWPRCCKAGDVTPFPSGRSMPEPREPGSTIEAAKGAAAADNYPTAEALLREAALVQDF